MTVDKKGRLYATNEQLFIRFLKAITKAELISVSITYTTQDVFPLGVFFISFCESRICVLYSMLIYWQLFSVIYGPLVKSQCSNTLVLCYHCKLSNTITSIKFFSYINDYSEIY